MDNEKIAHILYRIHQDDLKDAEMLCEYAEEIREAGDPSTAAVICQRAKVRMSNMQETERHIDSVLQRMVNEGAVMNISEMYENLYKTYMTHAEEKLRNKLNAM